VNGFESALSLAGDALRVLTEQPGYGISVWFLVWVFAWSGIAKLRRPALAAMAMVDFGVVRHVQPLLGGALGATELLLAFALALGMLSVLFLWIAAILLWLFVILIARSLYAGERFACFCFGNADSQLSRWTLARTSVLALFASALALVTKPGELYRGLHEADVLQAIAALSLIGTIVLLSYVPRLLDWNRNPLQPG